MVNLLPSLAGGGIGGGAGKAQQHSSIMPYIVKDRVRMGFEYSHSNGTQIVYIVYHDEMSYIHMKDSMLVGIATILQMSSLVQPLRAPSGGQGGIGRIQPTTAPQSSNPFVGEVALHNATALLPFSPELAKAYV